jgi:hypothetical protein
MKNGKSIYSDPIDKALIGAGGFFVAGIGLGSTGVGLPAGMSSEAVAGALETGGMFSKGVGSLLSVGSQVMASRATSNPLYNGPAIFSATTGVAPLKLGGVASFFQDKIASAASDMVGLGKIPQTCK